MMSKTIGFIGGGQMAEALIRGLLQATVLNAGQIRVAEPVAQRRRFLEDTYAVTCAPGAQDMAKQCDIIVLAVKPQMMSTVLAELKPLLCEQVIITIAAGIPLSFYSDSLELPDLAVIRVMPNTPALVLEAATALCRNKNVSDNDLAFAERLFSAIGTTTIVEERLMDGVTALSGSGPAYVFSFIEALVDGGIKVGLGKEVAEALAVQTILGSVRLLQESKQHPAVLRAQVTSPGGTTISALHVLEKSGFNGIIMDAVEAACKRSHELGSS